ncbi:MAG: pilus assembly protein [Lysobacterales bacterium]
MSIFDNQYNSVPTRLAVAFAAACLPLSGQVLAQAAAGTVDLLATPPEITTSVAPNLMISFDDSGSMGRNYMPDQRPFDGGGWGADDSQNFLGSADYNSGRPWLCAGVIDPRVTNPADVRSRPMNGVYYNPNTNYVPPYKTDGVTQFPDASFSAAWDNGITANWPNNGSNTVTTRNLGSGSRICGNSAGYYRLKSNVTLNVDADGNVTNTGTLYTASNWEWIALPTSERQNYANWYSYYHIRSLAARSAFSRAVAPFDENIRVVWQNFNSNRLASGTDIFKFVDLPANSNVRTRFYDWLYTHPVGGGTPNQATTVRAGDFFTRNNGARDENPYWDRDYVNPSNSRELSCRQNFHLNITDGLWNGTSVATATHDNDPTSQTLPDGRSYSTSDNQSKIMWNEDNPNVRTMADIAWHYWRTDLRPDFAGNVSTRLKVPPFLPDRSTNLFGVPLAAGQDPRDNKEIYWNPANDPATWPHLVQFFISFGADGTLPRTEANYQRLRRGTLEWPAPGSSDDGRKIDDVWHAALNSRGKFFSTANPDDLIVALNEIVASIIARRGASTAVSVSLPIITDGTTGYKAGYDTADWSGFITRNELDPDTAQSLSIIWDAGCILTGGNCASTAQTGLPARDPNTRVILTSDGIPGSGKPFRWTNLSATQKARLNVDPTSIRLDLGTYTSDTFGQQRVDYLRGVRTNESTASPRFRARSSVLGAVIRGQPVYVSSPTTGHRDTFPTGSPEQLAAASGFSYARYQNDQRGRRPMVYVAANDAMLHAFDAATGREQFAYVPNIVIENFRATKTTQVDSGLTPSVDDKPLVYDAFINGSWRTILLGSMRLGGRGVYAIDITNPTGVSETSPSPVPMWEFANVPPAGSSSTDCAPGARHCSSLGYTYDSVNVARLKYQNKWVALVSSGYFPKDSLDPASTSAAASRTSLLVIDLATGALIRELRTTAAPQTPAATFGLSEPIVYNIGNDNMDDLVVAGDLAGNLWRFDLSSDNPTNWKVDLIFRTYGNGGATNPGDQPIASAPIPLTDPVTRGPIFVFGTGKFIGLPDRSSGIPEQAFYGVRDYGTCDSVANPTACANYPIKVNQLVTQTLAQDSDGVRTVTTRNPVPDTSRGWRLRLNIPSEPGERSFGIPIPFYSANQVLLRSIIPKGTDPCNPGARYSLMVVRAEDGTAAVDPNLPVSARRVGGVLDSSTPPSEPITIRGGGTVVIAGLDDSPGGSATSELVREAIEDALSGADDVWHRGAWRELLNPQ